MRYIILFLLFLWASPVLALKVVTDQDFVNDRVTDRPYARFNRSDDLTLSTTWQRVDFNGSSSLNANTFPDLGSGVYSVGWDATNDLVTFGGSTLRLYNITVSLQVDGGVRPASVDMRFVIPSPTPIYFPFPDGQGYIDLMNIERRSEAGNTHSQIVRTSSLLLQYGLGVEVRTDIDGILVKPDLTDAIIEVYPQ